MDNDHVNWQKAFENPLLLMLRPQAIEVCHFLVKFRL